MYKSTDKYGFAIGKQIKKVFTESFLYRNGEYDEYTYEDLPLRRIDQPLYLLLDSGALVRLHSTSFDLADNYTKKYVFGKEFTPNKETQKEFEMLCGLTIVEISEVFESKYDFEDELDSLDSFGFPKDTSKPTDLIIIFDNGLRLVCNAFFDYFDVRIVDLFLQ